MEWLASPLVLWITVLIVFMVLIVTVGVLLTTNAVWILFEFYRAAVGDEDDAERPSHKSPHKQPPA